MTVELLALVDALIAIAKAEIPDKWTSYYELTHELLTFRRKAAATPEQSARTYLARDPHSHVEQGTESGEADGWQRFADRVRGLQPGPAPRAAKVRWEAQALEKEFCDRFVAIGRGGRIEGTGKHHNTLQRVPFGPELFDDPRLTLNLHRNSISLRSAEIVSVRVLLREPAEAVASSERESAAAHERRTPGTKPEKRKRIKEQMIQDVAKGHLTQTALLEMKQVALAMRYGVNRETALRAREDALSEMSNELSELSEL